MQGASNSQQQEVAQLKKLHVGGDRCLHLLKANRSRILSVEEALLKGFDTYAELEQFRARIESFAKEVTENYEKIEDEAKAQPAQTPSISRLNRLGGLLQDVATDSTIPDAYTNSRDAHDWAESTVSLLNYLIEFLKTQLFYPYSTGKRVLSAANRAPTAELPTFAQHSALDNPHRRFEAFFEPVLGHFQFQHNHKMRFVHRYLERSTMNSVIELKFLSMPTREMPTVDKQPVCFYKLLLLVNNGIVEFCQFIAPHEDWRYLETSPTQVDLGTESRYEMYQRLSTQGNIVARNVSVPTFDKEAFAYFLNVIARFYILDNRCFQCKKLLKDFSPPTFTRPDPGGPLQPKKLSYHLHCR